MSAQFAIDESAPVSEINTTPLIDVLLVLLIVLILMMPALTHKTAMDLGSNPSSITRPSITIDIEFDGSLYWDGLPVKDLDQLESYFRSIARQAEQPDVRINPNRAAKYDTVVKVLAAAQRNGVQRAGFSGQERFGD